MNEISERSVAYRVVLAETADADANQIYEWAKLDDALTCASVPDMNCYRSNVCISGRKG